MLLETVETQPQLPDPDRKQTSIGLQLGLTGTTHTDPAALPFEMRPAANQSRRQMLQLGQLDLQLTLVRACALGKDVENQRCSVEHRNAEGTCEITFLHRRKTMIEEHHAGLGRLDTRGDLIDLAATDQTARIRGGARRANQVAQLAAGRRGQGLEFLDLARGR